MKRAKKLFFKGFVTSLLLIGILGTIVVFFYGIYDQRKGLENEIPIVSDDSRDEGLAMEASVEAITKNLIFSWDKEEQTIEGMVLEIYNEPKGKLNYITIPVNLQIMMSDHLYKSLLLVNPAIPQRLKINSVIHYIQEDDLFDVSGRIIEDALGITLNYYTVAPHEVYKKVFVSKESVSGVAFEVFRKDYKAQLETLDTEEKIKNYIESLYEDIDSNLKLDEKIKLVEGYKRIKLADIAFEPLHGMDKNQGFMIDSVEVSKQIAPYLK